MDDQYLTAEDWALLNEWQTYSGHLNDLDTFLNPILDRHRAEAWDEGWDHRDDIERGIKCPPTDCNPYRPHAPIVDT